jgi:hypothetical protein
VGHFQRTGVGTALRAAVAAACCALLDGCAHRSRQPAGQACEPCPPPRTTTRPEAPGPRGALEQFLEAAGRGDFEAAFRLLASPLRARYTPARLASDYAAVRGLAQDKLARLRASLGADWRIGADEACLRVGEGKSARLVREPEGWRIAALE